MKKDVIKRVGTMILISGVLFGGVWGARTAYGAQFVRMDGDNWRLLSYVLPAARYEQTVMTQRWGDGRPQRTVGLCGYDAQDRPVCAIYPEKGILSSVQKWAYREGGYKCYDRMMSGFVCYTYETDAQGRETRCDANGHTTLYWYAGEEEDPCRYEYYDETGALAEYGETQTVKNADGTAVKTSVTWNGSGAVVLETRQEYDARGNMLSSMVDGGADGRSTASWVWRYDDIGRTATCIYGDGSETKTWYDEQGRIIKQDNDHGRWMTTTEYKDVTK